MHVQGSCHCGQITYEAEVNPAMVALCNCTDCQVLTGSAYRVTVHAPASGFRLLTGEPKSYVKTAESGNTRLHTFCPNCGTPIYATSVTDNPTAYGLRVGSLKQRAELPPQKRIWCRSALPWSQDVSGLPVFDKG